MIHTIFLSVLGVLSLETYNENVIIVDEDGTQWIPVKAAAALVGVSASTMRRKGKSGEIRGKFVPNSAGNADMYVLNMEDVERVKTAFSMLTVKKENSNQELAFALSRLIGEYLADQDSQVMDKLQEMEQTHQSEMQALQGELAEIRVLLQGEGGKAVRGHVEPPSERVSFWQRLRGKH